MNEKELIKALDLLCSNKAFLKRNGLKSMVIDEVDQDMDFANHSVCLLFETKTFKWTANINYTVDKSDSYRLMNTNWMIEYEIDRSSYSILEDYFCRSDINYTWTDDIIIDTRGTTSEEQAQNLVEDVVKYFNDQDLDKRWKHLSDIVSKLEEIDKEDLWIVAAIANVL